MATPALIVFNIPLNVKLFGSSEALSGVGVGLIISAAPDNAK